MATSLPSSTYLDYNSFYDSGYGQGPMPTGTVATSYTLNVALILERAHDPTRLLESNWGSRQKQLDALNDAGTLWTTYGAHKDKYDQVAANLPTGVVTVDSLATPGNASGYVSSWQSRTLWVEVTVNLDKHTFVGTDGFQNLFGTSLMKADGGGIYWNGSLSLPDNLASLGVVGLWFDSKAIGSVVPNASSGPSAPLQAGIQGPGNGEAKLSPSLTPQQMAEYYNFPLQGLNVPTEAIGLVEPGAGDYSQTGQPLAQLVGGYRSAVGLDPNVTVIGVEPGSFSSSATNSGGSSERALDVGMATAVNPRSTLILYAGSGGNLNAESDPFTAYQSAIWDEVNHPSVVSSSYKFSTDQPHPQSPFMVAARELFIDAALRNISLFSSAGDGGSSYALATGGNSVSNTRSSPYGVVVGGSSLSLEQYAAADTSLSDVFNPAMQGNLAMLWELVQGGLTAMPVANSNAWFVEAAWNHYVVDSVPVLNANGTWTPGSFGSNYTGSDAGNGGVDFTRPMPWYQDALLHLTPPTATDGTEAHGRGVPDVAAPAGGNLFYTVPNANFVGTGPDGGTSAATPFWASLIVQIDAIFADQGLPRLGYMTDLLYTAAAIAPGSFNDVTVGNNVSSYLTGNATGDIYNTGSDGPIVPTGYGYYAGPGYDLTTGLGSPNGMLLARTMTAIGHAQYFFDEDPVISGSARDGWTSGADQSLLLQTMSGNGATVHFSEGGNGHTFASPATAQFAWTSRLALQVLQDDFDPNLVRLFDKYGQGNVDSTMLSAGESLAVSIDGSHAQAWSVRLTDQFGFADFETANGALRVARPVAVAETAGAADDTFAIVRVRQNGENNVALSFYRVDDLDGTIAGLRPGDAAYAGAAQGRAYQLTSGGTSLGGPGYGNFEQTALRHVDAGDIIAFKLTNNTSGAVFWGFGQANETVAGQHVGHLWNYGLNTWGFEDTSDGGDRDYNDLVFGLDFTSASGHHWLV
jgi:hypothetical protein